MKKHVAHNLHQGTKPAQNLCSRFNTSSRNPAGLGNNFCRRSTLRGFIFSATGSRTEGKTRGRSDRENIREMKNEEKFRVHGALTETHLNVLSSLWHMQAPAANCIAKNSCLGTPHHPCIYSFVYCSSKRETEREKKVRRIYGGKSREKKPN